MRGIVRRGRRGVWRGAPVPEAAERSPQTSATISAAARARAREIGAAHARLMVVMSAMLAMPTAIRGPQIVSSPSL